MPPYLARRPANRADNIISRWGLRPIINCSGNNTALGASSVLPAVVDACSEIMAEFVDIADLHRKASGTIARVLGVEAGTVCSSLASGIAVSVAGCITGPDLARIERLPNTEGLPNEVLIQAGHDVHYGQPIQQPVRLGGGSLVRVGNPTRVMPFQLEAAFSENTVAGLFVVSHHAVHRGQIPFGQFVETCHRHDVPVIVDLADVQDIGYYHDLGADLTLHSAHKFMRGATAGIIAGRKQLVRAAFLQNYGIGRCMKIGKEGIAGAMVALDSWAEGVQQMGYANSARHIDYWRERLSGVPGVTVRVVDDAVNAGRALLRVEIDAAAANLPAAEATMRLAKRDRPVIVSDHDVVEGWFILNPYQLHPGEEVEVADALLEELSAAHAERVGAPGGDGRHVATNFTNFEAFLNWPD
jgi:D-glucosaminate-6-phosphate ammonia-lyase